jgi:type II restriction/modification system DNA methylase subunit YeeA
MPLDTTLLKKFSQSARRQLLSDVSTHLEQVLRADSIETREKKSAIADLKQQIAQSSKQDVIDQVAYTWFNRFCALRYMDVNHYTHLGIVSPLEGFTQPEILQEAKQGVIDADFKVDRQTALDILTGKIPSPDPQREAYQLLLVGACNYYHELMPFLFEPIADYTELLMPDDLLSENSILYKMREVLTPESCQDVEVIGWLYQFYISERKDEVFANLKKNIKIEAEDIPAATQLFTPHWIVRYLVENTLGRLWMLNHPESKLIGKMEYYIKPVQEETDFLRIQSPEEIKICDPACGSGHMLTYAFDLLYFIYEEQGYDSTRIPSLLLQKNLYGIEIDKRAGDLAAFALLMKARARDKRYFSRKLEPNICVLQNVVFTASEIDEYMRVVSRDLLTQDLWALLKQFEQAENYGSLIQSNIKNFTDVRNRLEERESLENIFLDNTNKKIRNILDQVGYLSSRYHVVVANPPYMNEKAMNNELKHFLRSFYSTVKSDLFSSFIIRNLKLALPKGYLGYVSPFVWMFLSSFNKLREILLTHYIILSLVKPEYHSFYESAHVPLCAFTVKKDISLPNFQAPFIDLSSFRGASIQSKKYLEALNNLHCSWLYWASPNDFKTIPGSPIAYRTTKKFRKSFQKNQQFIKHADCIQGIITGNTDLFLRYWFEVSNKKISKDLHDMNSANFSESYWIPYTKGGDFRKWFGNINYVINWRNQGNDFVRSRTKNAHYYLKPCITWTLITSSTFSARYLPNGFLWDVAGSVAFPQRSAEIYFLLGIVCSKYAEYVIRTINPTMNTNIENVQIIPIIDKKDIDSISLETNVKNAIEITKMDWNSGETSLYFMELDILKKEIYSDHLSEVYYLASKSAQNRSVRLQKIENENNKIIIDAYELQDELSPEVPLKDITLRCNAHYRYEKKESEAELEALFLADNIKEFISYSVGCMFGRYSLDTPGVILANQGETARDYYRLIPHPQFPPDEDNVIPILEEGWFTDDITERFKSFLRVTFGDEHYEENLSFIENAVGRDIRSYFLKEFYNEHVKMYKKRPIYWSFSSPNGNFNALIYMHRYRPDTVSVILNDYLREFIRKLNAHRAHLEDVSSRFGGSQAEKTKATKEINEINKVLAELKDYEDEVLYPLATRQIQIDLDDGVKVNYNKFGRALKNVNGLSEKK